MKEHKPFSGLTSLGDVQKHCPLCQVQICLQMIDDWQYEAITSDMSTWSALTT